MLFTDLPLHQALLKSLAAKDLVELTPIQAQAVPHALLGKDLLASSKTGSGKTLAFLLPSLHRILTQKALSAKDPRALILAPTRELAKQVYAEVRSFSSATSVKATLVVGGENFNDQVKALKRNPQIVVGTAGRVADHLEDRSLFLNGLELLILDEADRMLDLGFAQQLQQIHAAANHRKRQSMMFSATLDSAELHHFTELLLKAPQRIAIDAANQPHQDIQQRFYFADDIEHKEKLLQALLQQESYRQAIIFTATRSDTERLAQLLKDQGINSSALSGELNQTQRNQKMQQFAAGQSQVLVTTDIASRGLDLPNVSLVINLDLPKNSDEFVHRIGRTGRAGNKGTALSLVGPKDWKSFLAIKQFLQCELNFATVEGLEARFKGLAPKGVKKAKAKPQKNRPDEAKPVAKKVKRIDSLGGVDAGLSPLKRRPRKSIVDDDPEA